MAIVVPDPDEVCRWVKRKLDIEGATMAQLCARPVSSETDRVSNSRSIIYLWRTVQIHDSKIQHLLHVKFS